MRKNLTDKFCHHVRPPASGRLEVSDALTPGLQFRITDSGIKSWSLLYRHAGQQRRDTIGRFPGIGVAKARRLAGDALEAVGRGDDPRAEKAAVEAANQEAAGNTVKVVVDRFVASYAAQRRWRDLAGILRNEAVAAWGARPVASITRRDVLDRLDQIAERAPTRANRALSVFRLFFKWCRGRELIEVSPAADIDPLTVEVARERTLTDPEIVAFWNAATSQGWPFGDLFRLLLLTGCRRDEIGALRWSEINRGGVDVKIKGDDGKERTVKVPVLEISGERIKGGKPLVVPLSPPALDIIRELPRIGKSGLVFTTTDAAPVSGYSKAKTILDAFMLAELRKAATEPGDAKLEPFRLHDLRRTCRSGLSRLKVSADIAEMAIGHSLAGVRKIYDRYDYLAEKQDALDKWGARVLELVTPPPAVGKVIRLPQRARAPSTRR